MTQAQLRAGGEIVTRCSRCDLSLAHTIIAMIGSQPARVKCNTCKSERNYKAPKPEVILRSPREARPRISNEGLYNDKLKQSATRPEKSYRIDAQLEAQDVVDHKVFGRGVVLKTIPPDRAEVLFKDQMRVLVCRC